MGSDPTVSAPLQLLHTSAGRLHSNARHFSHPLLHAHQRNPMAGGKPPDNIVRHTYAQIQGNTPSPSEPSVAAACQRQLHPPLRQQQPAAEYRPTRNVSLQLRGRIRDTSERKRFSLRSASLQDKHHVYRLTEKPVDRLCRPRLCRALQL